MPRHSVTRLFAAILLVLGFVASRSVADEVVLRDGRSFDVDILETQPDAVTVCFQKEGTKGTVKVMANELDPHSFYDIRSRYMEKTAENHLTLARFCVENGLFTRAQSQVEKARVLDADFVEKKLQTPGLLDSVAADVLASAQKYFDKDDLENAQRYAWAVLTGFAETKASEPALALMKKIEARQMEKDEQQRTAAIAAAEKANEKAQAALEQEIKPLVDAYRKSRQLTTDALGEKSASKSSSMLENAAQQFEHLIGRGEELAKKHESDPVLLAEIRRSIAMVRNDAVGAWINAGGVEMSRGSLKKAGDFADNALKLDGANPDAKAFRARVDLAIASGDRWYRGRGR